jgi:hypothetical protein
MIIEGFATRVRMDDGKKVDALLLVDGAWRLVNTVEPERTGAFTAYVPVTTMVAAPVDPYGANVNEALRDIVDAHVPVVASQV